MLKLEIRNNKKGQPPLMYSDTNLADNTLKEVRFATVKSRGQGLHKGFKGRAGNRIIIDWGVRNWRAVVLPDEYDVTGIQSLSIVDSKNQQPPLLFVKDKVDPNRWNAVQTAPEESIVGPDRVYAVEKDFREKFDYLGGIGVNDLGYILAVRIQVPSDYDTDENKNEITNLAYDLKEKYETPVAVEFDVIGALGPSRGVLLEGKLGMSNHPEHAMAGRQQIEPMNVGSHPDPTTVAGIKPFTEGGEAKGLKPGQTGEPYGSYGPQDSGYESKE